MPTDLVYASGSGVDPHISLDAVFFQFDRVVRARNMDEKFKDQLKEIIKNLRHDRFLESMKRSFVNVLELNVSLDELEKRLKTEDGIKF